MEDNKKPIRIGKITFGIVLILIGIVIFIQTLTNLDILRYVLMLWPLVLISLGIEFLVYQNKQNVKYDIGGTIFVFIIISIVSLFSIANYGINKILYNKTLQEAICEYTSNSELNVSFKDKIIFSNIKNNNKVNIKINEIASASNTEVRIKVISNTENSKSYLNFIGIDVYDYLFLDDSLSQITLLDNFEKYDRIEIIVITSNKENVIIK